MKKKKNRYLRNIFSMIIVMRVEINQIMTFQKNEEKLSFNDSFCVCVFSFDPQSPLMAAAAFFFANYIKVHFAVKNYFHFPRKCLKQSRKKWKF